MPRTCSGGALSGSSAALLLWLVLVIPAHAGTLVAPGDPYLRSDIQTLADAGVLSAPVDEWPLPWATIAPDLERADPAKLTPTARAAWQRVMARLEKERGGAQLQASAAARAGKPALRWFQDSPRARQSVSAGVTGGADTAFGYKLDLTAVHEPDAGHDTFRPDGSYVSYQAGNWIMSAGWQDRWWGASWSGSTILGTNQRPMPGIAITRAHASPFKWPVFDWLGPWRFTLFADRFEDDRYIPHPWLFGARFSFKPVKNVTIGLFRNTMWGGEGMSEDWVHFRDMVTGTSYEGTGVPGNTLSGYDLRWHFDVAERPFALYIQETGEDTSKRFHLPRKFLGTLGLETSGEFASGRSWRVFGEYADTSTGFLGLNGPGNVYNIAYENFMYHSGYRYLGQAIGYPTDNDSRLWTLGGLFGDDTGQTISAMLRAGTLNRDDKNASPPGGNTIAPRRTTLANIELSWGVPLSFGRFTVTADINRLHPAGAGSRFENSIWISWAIGGPATGSW